MGSDLSVLRQYTNLLGGQYTTYALLSLRQIGEQPGRGTPHYLSEWRTLPNGLFIAAAKFTPTAPPAAAPFLTAASGPGPVSIPFPVATNYPNPAIGLPFVAFDYLGRLVLADGVTPKQADEYIPLAHGSIFYARGADNNFINQLADVQENPPGNSINNSNTIHIDWLTGRARVERQEVQ